MVRWSTLSPENLSRDRPHRAGDGSRPVRAGSRLTALIGPAMFLPPSRRFPVQTASFRRWRAGRTPLPSNGARLRSRCASRSSGTRRSGWCLSSGSITRWVTVVVAASMITRLTWPQAPSVQLALAPITYGVRSVIVRSPRLWTCYNSVPQQGLQTGLLGPEPLVSGLLRVFESSAFSIELKECLVPEHPTPDGRSPAPRRRTWLGVGWRC